MSDYVHQAVDAMDGQAEGDVPARTVTRSWVFRDSGSFNQSQSDGGHDVQQADVIVTTKSYEVPRRSWPPDEV
jgi:hypothetical protein